MDMKLRITVNIYDVGKLNSRLIKTTYMVLNKKIGSDIYHFHDPD